LFTAEEQETAMTILMTVTSPMLFLLAFAL
jgi:hypothetical protein